MRGRTTKHKNAQRPTPNTLTPASKPMELTDLQLFCDLVETRSFTRAAERNFLSQSAVSQRIRALERQYAQVLLERGRGKGKVAPTEAGQILYAGAKPL